MSNSTNSGKRSFDLEDRTLGFALEVVRLCKKLAHNQINKEIVSQLVRSSGSVGANYREANDALSKKDFAHRIRITRKEAKESHYWLQVLREANPELAGEIEHSMNEAVELKKIFSAIVERAS